MKKVLIGFALLLAAVAAGFVALPRQQHSAATAKTFDAYMNAMLEETAIPGASVAVIRGGDIVHLAGYGFADVESSRPMTPDTPMNVASVSKPILGIALLRLKDEGRLDLDGDVNAYLDFTVDNPNVSGEIISVRSLAAHTSGIADFYDPADATPGADSVVSLKDHLAGLLTPEGERYEDGGHYLNVQPGVEREYSNLGAGVAGAVVEAITGESLDQYQSRTLFGPMGLGATSWRLAGYAPQALATGYRVRECAPYLPVCADTEHSVANFLVSKVFDPPRRFKRFEPYPPTGNPNYPDGGLNSSARDLAALMKAILAGGTLDDFAMLEPATFEEMLRPQIPELSEEQRFFWRDRGGYTGHAGSDRGVFTYFYFNRETRNGFVALMNRTPVESTEIAMDAIRDRIAAEFFED